MLQAILTRLRSFFCSFSIFNGRTFHYKLLFITSAFLGFFSLNLFAQKPTSLHAAQLIQELEQLKVVGSVLYVAAHPDDENTRLLSYLSREAKLRTGYLSLTRGDGGQNLIGDEQGISLGLIRTQELLAARRTDGAEQFFTRAFDFGFSKTPEETFTKWDKSKILADVVWTIRKFKPDVIITRFPTTGEGGHGHHTASAILAVEAFDLAGDPKAFPEQLQFVQPWKPVRLLWNTFRFGSSNTIREDQFNIEVGQFNPLLGESYGEIAATSRSQHKSQGFGVPASRGEAKEYFTLLKGTAPKTSLTDQVNLSWSRLGNFGEVESKINQIIQNFKPSQPELSLPALLQLQEMMKKVPDETWRNYKLSKLQKIISAACGFFLEATSTEFQAVAGQAFTFDLQAIKRLNAAIKLESAVVFCGNDSFSVSLTEQLSTNIPFRKPLTISIPNNASSQPYWLIENMKEGYFTVPQQQRIGLPQLPGSLLVHIKLSINGVPMDWEIPVRYKFTDPVKGECYQPLQIVPPVLLSSQPDLLFTQTAFSSQAVPSNKLVHLKAVIQSQINLKSNTYRLELVGKSQLPNGKTEQKVLFSLKPNIDLTKGGTTIVPIEVPISGEMKNVSTMFLLLKPDINTSLQKTQDEVVWQSDRINIQYDHIPYQHYFYTDSIKLVHTNIVSKTKKIGYINGAGDRVASSLEQMGFEVTLLSEADLQSEKLATFDAIITGVRAYNVHKYLSDKYNVLMDYIQQGGTLIVQYNTNSQVGPVRAKMAPYPFQISRSRVTVEESPVVFSDPAHRVFHYPNKIDANDFRGWVQERGIYFADQIDPAYQTPLGLKEPGENEVYKGSLLIAPYGKGHFVYTGLVFFRQLPAGVPGAFRLMANLLALSTPLEDKKP